MNAPRAAALPGPWKVEDRRDDGYAVISAVNPKKSHGAFAKVIVKMDEDDFESPHLVATAVLVSAAPDLLDALEDMLAIHTARNVCGIARLTAVHQAAFAAIAKARAS